MYRQLRAGEGLLALKWKSLNPITKHSSRQTPTFLGAPTWASYPSQIEMFGKSLQLLFRQTLQVPGGHLCPERITHKHFG